MKNYIQRGDTVTAIAPAGGVESGDGVLIENLFGVASCDADAGDEFELVTVGVFELPKVSTDTIIWGQRVYWDTEEQKVSETDNSAEGYPIGVALEVAGNGVTTVKVRLDSVGTAGS